MVISPTGGWPSCDRLPGEAGPVACIRGEDAAGKDGIPGERGISGVRVAGVFGDTSMSTDASAHPHGPPRASVKDSGEGQVRIRHAR